jgi:outer membrane protein TolC
MNRSWLAAAGLAAAWVLAPHSAQALQPLDEFLKASRARSPLVLQSRALETSAEATASAESRRLWPSLTARAGYTRNEHASEARIPDGQGGFREATITPQDQLEAVLSLDVPLVDVAQWRRVGAASEGTQAARARAIDTTDGILRRVARAWHQVAAGEAVKAAATRSLAVAEKNLVQAEARLQAGTANELEQQRAVAEVARARQSLVEAERAADLARRTLQSLTGVTPAAGGADAEVPLEDPAPLPAEAGARVPAVQAAEAARRQAEGQASAANAVVLPTLAANLSERITNATGFSGENTAYTAGVTLTWRLDGASFAQADAQSAAARAQAHGATQTALEAQDRAYDAWLTVRSQVARVRAAMAEAAATKRAAELARTRFDNGASTQLEAVQAERDAFQAEVGAIQARADLAYARLDLSLALGEEVEP